MADLLLYCLVIVFKNCAVYICFREGMLLGRVRIIGANFFDAHFKATTSRYMLAASLWSV